MTERHRTANENRLQASTDDRRSGAMAAASRSMEPLRQCNHSESSPGRCLAGIR